MWLVTIQKHGVKEGGDSFVCQTYAKEIEQIIFLIELITHTEYTISIDMKAGENVKR